MPKQVSDEALQRVVDIYAREGRNLTKTSQRLGIPRSTAHARLGLARKRGIVPDPKEAELGDQGISGREGDAANEQVVRTVDLPDDGTEEFRIKDVEDAVRKAGVNLDVWEIYKVVVNGWDVTTKIRKDQTHTLRRAQNQQVKVWLRRKVSEGAEAAIERMLARVRGDAPKIPKLKIAKAAKGGRELECAVMDPHRGLRCFPPAADHVWTPELCDQMVMASVERMLEITKHWQPFEQVVVPLGNDWFHSDGVHHTTTAGTPQPESDAWHHTFIGGEQLAWRMIERLSQVAPVVVYEVPGNHSRVSDFALGRILKAAYHNNKNVTVHADPSPYKFHRYGVTLIGFEHGHSIKPIRLAALMAHECPQDWAETKYREWHLGDQHRKSAMKPTVMEEQGVAVEFLPGLTAGNEWHRIKAFNHQQRGATCFVRDKEAGPIAKMQVNVTRNEILGAV